MDRPRAHWPCLRLAPGANHVGLDLVTTRATTDLEPVEVLGEAIAQVVTEGDHGRKPDALARTIGDGLVSRLAHHGTRIRRDAVDTEHAAFGKPDRR